MNCTEFIASFEGFSPTPYKCPASVWTIGYGSTLGVTKDTPPITKEEALLLLEKDISRVKHSISKLIIVPLTENQRIALVSFTYNLGGGALQRSTLRQKLNRGEYEEVPEELMKWVWVGGIKQKGLVRRREAEADLFVL